MISLYQNLRTILRPVTRALGTGEAAGWMKGVALFLFLAEKGGQ